jgi:hypothetical protein
MPANGRWDLIRRLKGQSKKFLKFQKEKPKLDLAKLYAQRQKVQGVLKKNLVQ